MYLVNLSDKWIHQDVSSVRVITEEQSEEGEVDFPSS